MERAGARPAREPRAPRGARLVLLSDSYLKPKASSVPAQILRVIYSDERARLESVLQKGRLRYPSDPPSWQKIG